MFNQQEDLKHLGFLGIVKESLKLIFKYPKIFTKITLALILPLTLAEVAIDTFILGNAIPDISTLFNSSTQLNSSLFSNINSLLNSFQWSVYWLIFAIYHVFSFVFTLISISIVTYTVACIYNSKDITFKNVVTMISKVWRRLLITYVYRFCAIFGYALVILLLGGIMFYFSFEFGGEQVYLMIPICGIIVVILTLVGIGYMIIFWQFANVISVLETTCGSQAMTKSKTLNKGKMGTTIGISLVWIAFSLPNYLLKLLKMNDERVDVGDQKIWFIIFNVMWLTFLHLLDLVVHTIFYLVCKSYTSR